MKYLFDSDHVTFMQLPSAPERVVIEGRMALHHPVDFVLCIVSFHEQTLGGHQFINRAKKAADVIRGYGLMDTIRQTFSSMPVLPFDAAAARAYDALQSQAIRIGTLDLRIAAIALSHRLTVLTRNTRDFSRVPGLVTEDWTV